MYLPLFSDEHDITDIPVFYGAVSIYLKQLYPIFRNAPVWFDRLLNSKPVLKMAAGIAGSTRAKGLEEMTVSMLLGEEGQQKYELDRLIEWIIIHCRPDVIHLSNALLLGLAHRLKEKIKVPIVCSLQDEDTWVDVMKPSTRQLVWKLMETKAKDVDVFIAVSDHYKDIMKKKMNIPDDKLYRVHIGIDPGDYSFKTPSLKKRIIGFISRTCHENGLDILVDAFIELRQRKGFEDVQLAITGGSTGDDTRFIKNIRKKLRRNKLSDFVDFHEVFEGDGRQDFFSKISLLSVPVRNGEAFGIYLLEAMASGIPVVQPAVGAFPEIVKLAKGGILYQLNSPAQLADALAGLLPDTDLLDKLSSDGRAGIEKHFNTSKLTIEIIRIYSEIIEKKTESENVVKT